MIKIDCNLIYERIEKIKDRLIFESRFVYENIFVTFVIICMFLVFFNNKTKIKLSEQKVKA